MEYEEAFPCCFRMFLMVMYAAAIAAFAIAVICLEEANGQGPEDWATGGKWITGILITPFVALMGAYIWTHTKIRIPINKVSAVSFVFPTAGACLLGGIVMLLLFDVTGDNRFASTGLAFSLAALISVFSAAITAVRAWDAIRQK